MKKSLLIISLVPPAYRENELPKSFIMAIAIAVIVPKLHQFFISLVSSTRVTENTLCTQITA